MRLRCQNIVLAKSITTGLELPLPSRYIFHTYKISVKIDSIQFKICFLIMIKDKINAYHYKEYIEQKVYFERSRNNTRYFDFGEA